MIQQHADHDFKMSLKYLKEVFTLMEVDRTLIKFINIMAQQFIDDHQSFAPTRATQLVADGPIEDEPFKVKCMITFISEMLKFTLLSFFKRCKILFKILTMIRAMQQKKQQREAVQSDSVNLLFSSFWWFFDTLNTSFKSQKHKTCFQDISAF